MSFFLDFATVIQLTIDQEVRSKLDEPEFVDLCCPSSRSSQSPLATNVVNKCLDSHGLVCESGTHMAMLKHPQDTKS